MVSALQATTCIYIAVMRCVEGRMPNVNKVLETDCRMYKKFWITKLDSEVQNAMDLWFGATQRCCLKIQDSRRFDASHQDCYVQEGNVRKYVSKAIRGNGQPTTD